MLDILEELDVSAINRKYQEKDARGTRPYAPKMMVGLLLYGYSVGIRSSRKLEKATYEGIPFRVLAAGNHRTIRGSRSFAASISRSWRSVLAGLPDLSADGTGRAGQRGPGRDEGAGQRLEAQGDELRADA